MCGIAGLISKNGLLDESHLRQMTDRLAHRGPDADGLFMQNGVGLGHRRLSIIDLSSHANQPMYSACGRFVMVYNGEVYNYLEIASALQKDKPGFLFRTQSDTEVLLEAFAHWGPSFIKKTNGMFAIAIYDLKEDKLFLFRDRMGIKPLYLYQRNGVTLFASELKSITALRHKLELSHHPAALNAFLHLGYVPHPWSVYREVEKFPTGTWAEIEEHKTEFYHFWSPENILKKEMIYQEDEALAALRELLYSSVQYRMISDVPFGTFLSGGIDSSLVTAVASAISPEPIKTFSISFPESPRNEAAYALAVSRFLGTKHHAFEVTEKEGMNLVPNLAAIYDEPYGDSSAIPTFFVSKLARQHVTMTLSGDGGDELFMGYGSYQWATRLNDPTFFLFKGVLSSLFSMGSSRYKRISDLLMRVSPSVLKSHIFSQENYLFPRRELKSILQPDMFREFSIDELLRPLQRNLSAAEQQALFDMKYYLKDDLLVKVDRASMRHSLEARVPLLDYRIVEFSLNLSSSLKYRNGESKYLLKKLLYQHIPQELFNRPKWGFGIPLGKWLRGGLRNYMHDLLSDSSLRETGLLNPIQVNILIRRFENGEEHLYNRLWLLMMLQQWALAEKSEAR